MLGSWERCLAWLDFMGNSCESETLPVGLLMDPGAWPCPLIADRREGAAGSMLFAMGLRKQSVFRDGTGAERLDELPEVADQFRFLPPGVGIRNEHAAGGSVNDFAVA